jgi:hypothetical protein
MTLMLSLSVIVFLKSMPVCFGLNSWNLVDLEQEINNDTEHIRNKSFLMLYNYNKNKYLQPVYLVQPLPLEGGAKTLKGLHKGHKGLFQQSPGG